MTTRASVTSSERYRVTINPTPSEDPTDLPVRFAFPAEGQPPETWVNGLWEAGGPPWIAATDIGPGSDTELEAGSYDVYVEITDTNETPRFQVDRLVIFETVTLFASVSELADVIHADLDPEDPQAFQALLDATAYIRAKTGQTISLVEGDEQELMGTWKRRFWLPQRPVLDVSEVSIRYPYSLTYVSVAASSIRATRLGKVTGSIDWGGPDASVLVTYDHGYEVIPEDVRMACLHLAGQNYTALVSVLAGATGENETIGSYSHGVTYSEATAGNLDVETTLPAAVQAVLDKYGVSFYD